MSENVEKYKSQTPNTSAIHTLMDRIYILTESEEQTWNAAREMENGHFKYVDYKDYLKKKPSL